MAQAAGSKTKKIFDGRYEILSIVGRGSGSVVYHARHALAPTSEIALKVLLEQKDHGSNSDRLRKEALAMVSSRHKYVIKLDDFHSVGQLCYLSMEYAPESDLRKYISKSGGKLRPAQAELFFQQCAEALAFIHKAGIIHRDIKPDNILVINDREVRVADFGLAVLPGEQASVTELQSGVGTMSYMAPEVLEGNAYTQRSDLYALAITFYEMLAGSHPFDKAPLLEQILIRKDGRLKPISDLVPGLPSHLAATIMRALRFNPSDRFSSAKEMVSSLQNKSEAIVISPPSPVTASPLRVVENKPSAASTAVAKGQLISSGVVQTGVVQMTAAKPLSLAPKLNSSPETSSPEHVSSSIASEANPKSESTSSPVVSASTAPISLFKTTEAVGTNVSTMAPKTEAPISNSDPVARAEINTAKSTASPVTIGLQPIQSSIPAPIPAGIGPRASNIPAPVGPIAPVSIPTPAAINPLASNTSLVDSTKTASSLPGLAVSADINNKVVAFQPSKAPPAPTASIPSKYNAPTMPVPNENPTVILNPTTPGISPASTVRPTIPNSLSTSGAISSTTISGVPVSNSLANSAPTSQNVAPIAPIGAPIVRPELPNNANSPKSPIPAPGIVAKPIAGVPPHIYPEHAPTVILSSLPTANAVSASANVTPASADTLGTAIAKQPAVIATPLPPPKPLSGFTAAPTPGVQASQVATITAAPIGVSQTTLLSEKANIPAASNTASGPVSTATSLGNSQANASPQTSSSSFNFSPTAFSPTPTISTTSPVVTKGTPPQLGVNPPSVPSYVSPVAKPLVTPVISPPQMPTNIGSTVKPAIGAQVIGTPVIGAPVIGTQAISPISPTQTAGQSSTLTQPTTASSITPTPSSAIAVSTPAPKAANVEINPPPTHAQADLLEPTVILDQAAVRKKLPPATQAALQKAGILGPTENPSTVANAASPSSISQPASVAKPATGSSAMELKDKKSEAKPLSGREALKSAVQKKDDPLAMAGLSEAPPAAATSPIKSETEPRLKFNHILAIVLTLFFFAFLVPSARHKVNRLSKQYLKVDLSKTLPGFEEAAPENSSPIPHFQAESLTAETAANFPHLPAGLYSGTLKNFSPLHPEVALSLISYPADTRSSDPDVVIVLIGVEGWTPQVVELDREPSDLRVASNGIVMKFVFEKLNEKGEIEGSASNIITSEEGQWSLKPAR